MITITIYKGTKKVISDSSELLIEFGTQTLYKALLDSSFKVVSSQTPVDYINKSMEFCNNVADRILLHFGYDVFFTKDTLVILIKKIFVKEYSKIIIDDTFVYNKDDIGSIYPFVHIFGLILNILIEWQKTGISREYNENALITDHWCYIPIKNSIFKNTALNGLQIIKVLDKKAQEERIVMHVNSCLIKFCLYQKLI